MKVGLRNGRAGLVSGDLTESYAFRKQKKKKKLNESYRETTGEGCYKALIGSLN